MDIDKEKIVVLERSNYKASQLAFANNPHVELALRDNVILTRSPLFPLPDTNHACLLQASSEQTDALITEVIDYFQAKNLTPTVFVSPACTPDDLASRLEQRGFTRQETEAWLVYENLSAAKLPRQVAHIPVNLITPAEAPLFVDVFKQAFDLPPEYVEGMTRLITPSIGLPGVYHYLAYADDEPVGTFSLICYDGFGILGSAGVIPRKRGSRVIFNLIVAAARQAQADGVETVVLQTTAGFMLERLLGMAGFKKIFTRTSYSLL